MTPADIKQIRTTLGLTQDQFADKLGVSRQTVVGWEKGQHEPHPILIGILRKLEKRVK